MARLAEHNALRTIKHNIFNKILACQMLCIVRKQVRNHKPHFHIKAKHFLKENTITYNRGCEIKVTQARAYNKSCVFHAIRPLSPVIVGW